MLHEPNEDAQHARARERAFMAARAAAPAVSDSDDDDEALAEALLQAKTMRVERRAEAVRVNAIVADADRCAAEGQLMDAISHLTEVSVSHHPPLCLPVSSIPTLLAGASTHSKRCQLAG